MADNKDYIQLEEAWFKKNLKDLLENHRGKWAVVYQQKLLGVYDSFSEAYEEGINLANSDHILVRQIRDDDEPRDISINYSLGLYDAPNPG